MLYGLIGTELSHSRSPELFEELFLKNNIDGTYSLFELTSINDLPKLLKDNPLLGGFTVTMPFKRDILSYLDSISEEAKKIGAVNTVNIKVDSNGVKTLHGFNTDVIGFAKMLEIYNNPNNKVLVFGTGGAADSVKYVLKNHGIEYKVVSRNPTNKMLSYENLGIKNLMDFDWLINATPVGMHPLEDDCLDINYDQINKKHICLDLIYNPEETLFLKKCKDKGARIQNGFTMLKEQAKQAFKIFQNN